MFSNDRNHLRKFFFAAWQKHVAKKLLEPLEAQIVKVILTHPEYQETFNNADNQDKDFVGVNPFLHMSLHLAIHEQISTNRPKGIAEIYKTLSVKFSDVHVAEHAMMECLAEMLSEAQVSGKMPDESVYLENLKKLG